MLNRMWKRKELRLFKKRFKSKAKSSAKMDDEEFFKELICEIKNKYSERATERINSGDINYITREKRRLEFEIDSQNLYAHDSQLMPIMLSTTLPIVVIIFGNMQDGYLGGLKFKIENTIRNEIGQGFVNKMTKIYTDASYELNNETIKYIMIIMGVYLIAFIVSEVLNSYYKHKNNQKIKFNKMCIDALNEIQSEIQEKPKIIL